MHVFGPEAHMTSIVGMALGKTEVPDIKDSNNSIKDNFLFGKVRIKDNFLFRKLERYIIIY